MGTQPTFGHEGPLAEFAALRSEIDRRASTQNTLFVSQLTVTGAIFSFAVSAPSRTALLLILPISSYMFGVRYVAQQKAIFTIARYIREDLSARVPGGLKWEAWINQRRRASPRASDVILDYTWPIMFLFPGLSLLSILWLVPTIFFVDWTHNTVQRVGLALVWLLDLGVVAVTTGLVQRGIDLNLLRRSPLAVSSARQDADL